MLGIHDDARCGPMAELITKLWSAAERRRQTSNSEEKFLASAADLRFLRVPHQNVVGRCGTAWENRTCPPGIWAPNQLPKLAVTVRTIVTLAQAILGPPRSASWMTTDLPIMADPGNQEVTSVKNFFPCTLPTVVSRSMVLCFLERSPTSQDKGLDGPQWRA
ncbi:hypothetical protein EYF80_032256 [Liparis tanakae]|uniref:Uncharacterized protein n=1 Tax=Liparis tanakae TaxID=230148 RepID=A0A4Z2GY00_9TELE|nr:hypothetical protein EYF80_032256 [Liparis tanakae]